MFVNDSFLKKMAEMEEGGEHTKVKKKITIITSEAIFLLQISILLMSHS